MTDDTTPPPPPGSGSGSGGKAPPPPPPPTQGGGTPPPPPPAGGPPDDDANRGVLVALAYLGPLALVPLLLETEDEDVRWHGKHGLVLFAAEVLLFSFVGIVASHLGCLGCFLWLGISVPVLAFHVAAIVKGVGGERLKIPGLSDLADRF